jgi:putative oxidoreductase
MKDGTCCTSCTDKGLLIGRIIVGGVFIAHGVMKLQGIDGFASNLEGTLGGASMAVAWIVAILELLGGVGILLGIWTKIFAGVLAVIMIGALALVHNDLFSSKEGFMGAGAALGFLAATVILAGTGGGKYSLGKCKCS